MNKKYMTVSNNNINFLKSLIKILKKGKKEQPEKSHIYEIQIANLKIAVNFLNKLLAS